MARVRQALRCHAHRSDGEPCGNYAIVGGTVCRMHGGAAAHVRAAADRRMVDRRFAAMMAAQMHRYTERRRRWLEQAVMVAAEVFEIEPEQVTDYDLTLARVAVRLPAPPEPTIDARYGPREARPNGAYAR